MLCVFALTGCGDSSIVGTWAYVTSDGEITESRMSFYQDGTCVNTPVRTSTSADALRYKMQNDGVIIFDMEWDGPITVERTDDKELALDDRDFYYLDGNTLILRKDTYVRQ